MEERFLLARLQHKDEKALAQLIDQYAGYVLATVRAAGETSPPSRMHERPLPAARATARLAVTMVTLAVMPAARIGLN